ncbi:pyridoxal phosphate-dependent aminotransferase [bacterium]|nr:pyridoxal phosphate-dependent aminotransferase [bacterium]
MHHVSKLAVATPPFYVMEVLERAQELENAGVDIVHMEVGEPDFDSPAAARKAGAAAIDTSDTHYTHSLGKPELREAIAAWHRNQYGVAVDPECVLVTVGTSAALLLTFLAIGDPGDEVIIPDPYYACYPNIIAAAGAVPVRVPIREEDGFALDPDAVRGAITKRTRALLINSPANPTGAVMPREAIAALAELPVPVVSDEIYHGLTYKHRAASLGEFTQDGIVINGFSKLFAMTGWRLGYAIVPHDLVRPMRNLQQNFFISAPSFAQTAANAALTHAAVDVERMRVFYDERRRAVLAGLAKLGLAPKVEPTGAFYVFVDVRELCRATGFNSLALAFDILERAHVAVTPGTDFGPGGEGYIRLSYANHLDRLMEGLRRLGGYIAERG